MTFLWQGWSSDIYQVHKTQILRLLLSDLTPADEQTRISVEEAAVQLGIDDINIAHLAIEFVQSGVFFDSGSIAPGSGTEVITPRGRDIAREFQQSTSPSLRRRKASRAILLWLDEVDEAPHGTFDILLAPHSWFYGQQFTKAEITEAGRRLVDDGWIHGTKTWGGPVFRPKLTDRGEICAEVFDGDVIEMQKTPTGDGAININTYNQQGGNAAFGSTVESQYSVSITVADAAADVAAIIAALQDLGAIPEAEADEVEQVRAAMVGQSTDVADVEHLRKGHRLLSKLAPVVKPIYHGLVNAGIHYAELRLGIA